MLVYSFVRQPADKEQLDAFNALNAEYATLPQNFTEDVIMRAPSPDIMNKIQSGIVSLYSYDPNPEDMSLENQLKQSIQIISRLPIIAAHAYSVKRHVFDKDSLLLRRPLPGLQTKSRRIFHFPHGMIRAGNDRLQKYSHF